MKRNRSNKRHLQQRLLKRLKQLPQLLNKGLGEPSLNSLKSHADLCYLIASKIFFFDAIFLTLLSVTALTLLLKLHEYCARYFAA
ncbi:MAG: hypothetical protein DMF69_22395 [Acidobacteria bacterium]|nr:MAG: hypothetical protein DMF69_22395 [Acidobacteriota bacterium]